MIRTLLLAVATLMAVTSTAQELVFQDADGVIRYTADSTEMAIFGVNYCLPSASDYRAAHKVAPTLEAKRQMIDTDLCHLERMGMRALRLSFWGDWENSDKRGNLLDNEHLELLDYLVYRASQRGMLMLFSPIVAHAAWWPDGDRNLPGLTAHFGKEQLTFDREAIRAQKRYMTQFLHYRNRYTGRTYGEEPSIIAVEILNEPARVMGRNEEIRQYIDTMTEAIRAAGCQKIVAYNLSENFSTAEAIAASKAQAATYGWYPTLLTHGHTLRGNFLPYVNDFTPMKRVEIGPRAKFVYEFDAADLTCSYMYPAQVREFREGGVQWAAMFSYDMIGTAPWNLGWQTHLLNLVFTPKKAISAMIAAYAMKALPRGKNWGSYPNNSTFGPVQVDWKADRSIYYDGESLLYSNGLSTDAEVDGDALTQLAGTASSPFVHYAGSGAYFLDKLAPGVWMLEIYPGATQLQDPFQHNPTLDRQLFAYECNPQWMTIALPDLGSEFYIYHCASEHSANLTKAVRGGFRAECARYILATDGEQAQQMGALHREGARLTDALPVALWEAAGYKAPAEVTPREELLFDPQRDFEKLIFTRGGFFSPSFEAKLTHEKSLTLWCDDLRAKEEYWFPADVSVQHYIGDRRGAEGRTPKAIKVRVRALTPTTERMRLLLSEEDFGSWGIVLSISQEWQTISIPISSLQPDRTPQLPQDWPGFGPYYRPDFGGTGQQVDWSSAEHLYFALRAEDFTDRGQQAKAIEIDWVKLCY